MLLLLIYCLRQNYYTIDDIAFGVFTGENVFDSRAIKLAQTWFQFLPQIDLYTDSLTRSNAIDIYKASSHLNLTIHIAKSFDMYLKYTFSDDPWIGAQNRHLFTYYDLFKRYPNKKWYCITDDDTFLQPNLIPYFLNKYQYDYHESIGIGHRYTYPQPTDIDFLQGGGGVLYSHLMMKEISTIAINCSIIRKGQMLPSDVRISQCLHDYYQTVKNASKHPLFISSKGYLSGINLENKEKHRKNLSFISYHKIYGEYFDFIYNASYCVWKDAKRIERYCDFSIYAGTKLYVPFFNYNQLALFMFGMYFQMSETLDFIKAFTSLTPIFDKNDKKMENPVKFVQLYEANIELTYICDNTLNEDEFAFDSFYSNEKKGMNFLVHCPSSKTFLHNSNGKRSPKHPIIYHKNFDN